MKYKAIIFDMDGTIIDTERIWKEASKQLIAHRNIKLTAEEECELEKELCGRALPDSCLIIKNRMHLEDELQELVRQKGEIANAMYPTYACYIPGFSNFHALACSLGLKTAIATNACKETVEIANNTLNLQSYFGNHIYNRTFVERPKPHPDLYLFSAERLGIDPKECLAIEDSAAGLTAAKNAGMFCIGINTSKRPETLKDAHLIIENYNEIDLHAILKKGML